MSATTEFKLTKRHQTAIERITANGPLRRRLVAVVRHQP